MARGKKQKNRGTKRPALAPPPGESDDEAPGAEPVTQLAGAAAPERPPAAGVRDPRVALADDVARRHEAAVLLAQFREDAATHAERVGYVYFAKMASTSVDDLIFH